MRRIFIILFFITCSKAIFSQGVNTYWNVGYGSYWGSPFGHSILNFFNGSPIISYDTSNFVDVNRTSANIADASGNLLFYSNGYYVADASNDTMQNGDNISPTPFSQIEPNGLTVSQACLILPNPGSANKYYLFHSTLDNGPYYNKAHYLYLSEIDMTLNGGLGGVVNKNIILLQDTLNPGKITACKHANGRDWWVIVQRVNSNTYYKFIVTPSVILGPYTQNIGSSRTNWFGMAVFSPDGTKYATFHAEYLTTGGLDIYDFNRCNGTLTNPVHIVIPQSASFSCGLAYSSNSRFLYTCNTFDLYQFDMLAANIAASRTTVAQWDSFYSPSPPFATGFEIPQLAPDGKIYISTGNSTFHMHVINNPDSAGLACDVVQHGIQFQYYYANGIPNHPNYFLGCDTTLGCTTCYTGLSTDMYLQESEIKAWPNPGYGNVTLQFAVQSTAGMAEVYDINGKLVLQDYIAPWSQYKHVDISTLPNGIYLCKLNWQNNIASIKIIKQ